MYGFKSEVLIWNDILINIIIILTYLPAKLDDALNGKPNILIPRSASARFVIKMLVVVLNDLNFHTTINTRVFPQIPNSPVSRDKVRLNQRCLNYMRENKLAC